MATRNCSVSGCDGKHYGKGLCHKHYQRKRKTGSLELKTKTLKPLEQRFHEKYLICPMSGCWIWTASTKGGYGCIGVGEKTVRAHRLSWELHNSPIPEGMHVCHTCDVRCCVNPDHLFLGTQKDNMDDMVTKGRHARVAPKGSAHGQAKLTEGQALEVYHAEGPQRGIAANYGVSQRLVSLIKRKEGWRHIHEQRI